MSTVNRKKPFVVMTAERDRRGVEVMVSSFSELEGVVKVKLGSRL